jgi:hypothetical protein
MSSTDHIPLERVISLIRNSIEMRETETAKGSCRPWILYFYAIFTQVHNTL